MRLSIRHKALLTLALWAGSGALAIAHPLHGWPDFSAALAHPFTGADHLLAMLLVGICAALSGKGSRWVAPLGFTLALIGGALAGAAGWSWPWVETGIAFSLVLLGGLCFVGARIGAPAVALCAALAGLGHGYAHGLELTGQGAALAGMLLGALLLQALGLVAAVAARPRCAPALAS